MNIYIFADLEGISGIYAADQITPDQRRFAEARRYMTRDVNICAAACKEAGVEKVYVRDGHGGGYTLLWDQLSPDVDFAVCGGTGEKRFVGIEDCDAVILLGYHAMAGTPHALLEHTMSSKGMQNYWLNGVRVGEFAIDAAILTDYNKPVIMVSGDDAVCAEAKRFCPNVTAVEVKKDSMLFGTMLLSPRIAEERIREGVRTAIENFKAGIFDLYPTEKPIRLRVELVERGQIPNQAAKPYMTVIDGRTYEVCADSAEEALFRL